MAEREAVFDVKKLLASTDEEIDQYVDEISEPVGDDKWTYLPMDFDVPRERVNEVIQALVGEFVCERCGRCCEKTTEGIMIQPGEVERLAGLAGLSKKQFKDRHTFTTQGKRHLKAPCFFYRDGCSIYDSRPWVCRIHPMTVRSGYEGYNIEALSSCLGAVSLAKRIYKYRTRQAKRAAESKQ